MSSDSLGQNGMSPDETSIGQLTSIDLTPHAHGLSPGQVRGALSALSAELEPIYIQMAALIRENDQLRRQSTRSSRATSATEEEHDQAVALLTQAQELADALITDASTQARDLVLAGRAHQRQIVKQAAALPTIAPAGGGEINSDGALVVEPLAKLAQRQFLAVLDTLREQVNHLGEDDAADDTASPAAGKVRQAAS